MSKKYYIKINYSSFTILLTLTFVILKLCNVINWSWWFVLGPLWIPVIALFFAWLIIYIIGWLLFRNSKYNFKEDW